MGGSRSNSGSCGEQGNRDGHTLPTGAVDQTGAPSDLPYVEVAVMVPIRRTFQEPAQSPEYHDSAVPKQEDLGLFHYRIPVHLQGEVRAGHLLNVPFGSRKLQGFAVRLAASSPVPARDVLGLARQDPVLFPHQLELAIWMSHYHAASLSACLALLTPPGMLTRKGGQPAARARLDWLLQLKIPASEFRIRLSEAGRVTRQSGVLAWLLHHPGQTPSPAELGAACGMPKPGPVLRAMVRKNWIHMEANGVSLALETEAAWRRLLEIQGTWKYMACLGALAELGDAVWKSDLRTRSGTTLRDLRWLAERDFIHLEQRQRYRDPLAGHAYPVMAPHRLTDAQRQALEAVVARWENPDAASRSMLIQGVTGSGKTEVYLQAIERCLAMGRQAVVLVPEIALTHQTVRRFAGRFPGQVSVMHSRLSVGERYDVWRQVRAGQVGVLVGARSALYAPFPRLGLIVMDEEHDDAYKQSTEEWGSNTVFYDARRVAARLARISDAMLLLGSATPSLEILHRVHQGQVGRVHLRQRVGTSEAGGEMLAMPPVELIDMRQELMAGNRSVFSRSLRDHLLQALARGEQAILFMNRRGTRTFVMCRICGHVVTCRSCSSILVHHQDAQSLRCHTCDRTYVVRRDCPECGDRRIRYMGAGTQFIESALGELATGVRVLRWDADTTRTKGSHADILERFRSHQADVLVGTQMIAKGLDLPRVTLVGVMAADVGLYLPDFRAPERTCQLLVQVAGRAGRGARGGRVVIQTYSPEHYAIQAAVEHDYEAFSRHELDFRRRMAYPPHRRMAKLVLWERNETKARKMAQETELNLRRALTDMERDGEDLELLGPVAPFQERIRGYWRWQILVMGRDPAALLRRVALPHGWRVDLDPVSTL